MRAYSVAEADTHFREMLDRVKSGETVVVTEDGAAIAELSPATAVSGTFSPEEQLTKVRALFRGVTLDELVSARHEGHKY